MQDAKQNCDRVEGKIPRGRTAQGTTKRTSVWLKQGLEDNLMQGLRPDGGTDRCLAPACRTLCVGQHTLIADLAAFSAAKVS